MTEETNKKFIILGRLGKLCEATGPSREAVIAELKKNSQLMASLQNPVIPTLGITVGLFIWQEFNKAGRKMKEVETNAR